MLRNKNLTKILSLLVAILIWAYVIAIENPPTTQTITKIPVELLNVGTLTQNGFAILEGENATVDVVVTGTRADISKYRDQIMATANVFGYKIGSNNIRVDVSLPAALTCMEVKPARVSVKIENMVSVYKPVNITITGEANPSTEPGSITIQPEQIEVKGAKSLVESVSYVGVEMPYSQIRRSGSTLLLPAVALNAEGEAVPNVRLSSDSITVRATLYDTKTVALVVDINGQVDEKYEMTMLDVPETIKIRGNKNALAKIESIEAEPIDISTVEVTSELPVKPVLPQGIEVASGSYNVHVNIGIKGISTLSFDYDYPEIAINGVREGLTAYINTPSVTMKIAGKEAILNTIEKEDFLLSVNLEGLDAGMYIVPVFVTHDKALSNLELIPGEVHITINEDV